MSALGAGAERQLAAKRIGLRITVIGAEKAGKTSLIQSLVNNVFYERYTPTNHYTLYYATFSKRADEDDPKSAKFNTILEIEDTPACEKLDKDLSQVFDPYWPKTETLVKSKKPPTDKEDKKTGQKFSVGLPFSVLYAQVGKYNDEDNAVSVMDSGDWPYDWYFCGKKDKDARFTDKTCSATTKDGNLWKHENIPINRALGQKPPPGHECESCIRFKAALKGEGEYRPLFRRRMAYIFLFDATKKASYLEVLKRYNEFQEFMEQKKDPMKPVVFLVGNKIDQMYAEADGDENPNDYKGISTHLNSFVAEQSEQGIAVSKAWVSAMQFKGVQKLFRSIVGDLHSREPLWKQDPSAAGGEDEEAASGCTVH